MRPRLLLSLALLFTLASCKSTRPVGSDAPDVPDFAHGEYPDAIRLSNGTVNLLIVPSIGGRIMRYGYVGGPNVLWNNPKLPKATDPSPATRPTYINYGGDKAWPWPQDEWPLRIGRTYPPPDECDQAPFKSRLIGSHGVRLESPPIPSHAARIVREIILEPAGTRVTIVTRLEQGTADRPPPSMAAWSVTQIPGNARLYARLLPDGVTRPMAPATAPIATRPLDDGRAIALDPPSPRAAKLGLDADILAAAVGNVLFVQNSQTAATAARGYRGTERAQVFVQQADKPKLDVPRYAELEFTSPRQDLAAGEVPELRVTWELRQHPAGWTDDRVAAFLRNDTPEPANLLPPLDVP
jgi:hypothetical protein